MATKLNKEESDLIDSLIYVKRSNGRYGGWKFDILTKRINVETEKMMVTCTVCMGLSRDPNLIQVSGMQQIMCSMCVPSGVGILAAAQMNRFLINQKHVSIILCCLFTNSYCRFHLLGELSLQLERLHMDRYNFEYKTALGEMYLLPCKMSSWVCLKGGKK